jgi:hypothetical protein
MSMPLDSVDDKIDAIHLKISLLLFRSLLVACSQLLSIDYTNRSTVVAWRWSFGRCRLKRAMSVCSTFTARMLYRGQMLMSALPLALALEGSADRSPCP